MRNILIIVFVSISFSASAQWWRLDLKLKKKFVRPLTEQLVGHSIKNLPAEKINYPKISPFQIRPSDYSLGAGEAIIMTAAQHNMRFRVYADASYNFSELARLYIQENRLSEAKWYLLQSIYISRQEKNDRLTIMDLVDLANIKAKIGDYVLAEKDILEARDIATLSRINDYQSEIEKTLLYIKQKMLPPVKPGLGYARPTKMPAAQAKKSPPGWLMARAQVNLL